MVRPHLECYFSVETTVNERHELAGGRPENGHKNNPKGGTPPQQGQAEIFGAIQLGEEKTPGRLYSGLSVFKGRL